MDDLEKAILLAYDSGGAASASGNSSAAVRADALAYCERARSAASPEALLRLCLSGLSSSPYLPVQFWCLQSLHSAAAAAAFSGADVAVLRSSLLSLASSPSPSSPHFLRNKLAQLLALLIRLHYPTPYASFFLDLLPPWPSPTSPEAAARVDMFARVLVALDDDLLSLDYPRSPDDAAAATRVKDAMRVQGVLPEIARHWLDAAAAFRSADPSAAAAALDAARRFVPWIDVSLLANDAFLPLLFDVSLSDSSPTPLRAAAVGCLRAIAAKRMDPRPKLSLLRSLHLGPRVLAAVDPETILKLAPLITTYTASALDCYKRLGPSDRDTAATLELLEEALPSVFCIAESCDDEDVDAGSVLEFLSGYVAAMKSPSEKQLIYLGRILQIVRSQMLYDPAYRANLDALDKIGKEEEDQMAEHRKDLVSLFRSICRVAPGATQAFIRGLLVTALSSAEAGVEDVEVALTLFYRLGETVGEEEIRTGAGLLRELVPMLLMARFSCHAHRMVALVYLEAVTRYMKFVQENVQYVPHLLTAFLDDRGVHHANIHVSRRAGYLFMRAVKLLKTKLVPYLDTILQSLEDIVGQFTSIDWRIKDVKFSCSEDGSQTFEAIGLLIGMEDVSPEKQTRCVAALLNPLCQQIESLVMDPKTHGLEESSAKVLTLQQIIMALNAVSKGFNERLVMGIRPAIGVMFKQTLDVVLQVLVLFPNVRPLRSKITSFLHRMIEILGNSIFPCLPVALKQLLVENEAKDMVDFLVLINQIICKFNTSVRSILEDVFPTIANRFFMILSQDAFSSGPGSITEEIRELQDLQRMLYTFFHAMATHDLSSVLLAPNCRQFLDAIMQLLLFTSCSHKDIQLRKACVQIFVRLIKDWCTSSKNEDKLPGFRVFVIEKFATNCCLYSVLDKSFDFRDANTLVLFGEIVMAQKIMYERFGDDFIISFISKVLPAAHCPPNLAEQYYQKLQGNDIKVLKSFYQSLIENLRQLQNGSLVFR